MWKKYPLIYQIDIESQFLLQYVKTNLKYCLKCLLKNSTITKQEEVGRIFYTKMNSMIKIEYYTKNITEFNWRMKNGWKLRFSTLSTKCTRCIGNVPSTSFNNAENPVLSLPERHEEPKKNRKRPIVLFTKQIQKYKKEWYINKYQKWFKNILCWKAKFTTPKVL